VNESDVIAAQQRAREFVEMAEEWCPCGGLFLADMNADSPGIAPTT
jgi:hypothetical protein